MSVKIRKAAGKMVYEGVKLSGRGPFFLLHPVIHPIFNICQFNLVMCNRTPIIHPKDLSCWTCLGSESFAEKS